MNRWPDRAKAGVIVFLLLIASRSVLATGPTIIMIYGGSLQEPIFAFVKYDSDLGTYAFLSSWTNGTAPNLFAQTDPRWRFPFSVEVLADVPVLPYPQKGNEQRGVIYTDRGVKPFVIKKGQTFQTIRYNGEGSCAIRFARKDYLLASCYWMPGFTDPQADIFKVIPKKD